MKKIVILFVIFLFPIGIKAYTDTAKSTIVMDMDSGRILYKNNINEKRLIASTTKIMTAIVTIENTNLNKKIKVGEEILEMYGSNIYIEIGEEITIKDLLYGLLLRSGNDAAIVLSKNVSGSEEKFVKLMNKKAKELGMTSTTFKNCHGLDEKNKNYSTAKDMAILSMYAYKNEIFKEITKTRKYILKTNKKSYIWYNRNKILSLYKYATGGKTGYTPSAGRTLVTTATKDDLNLTIVTLKDNDEYNTHKSLYEYFFNNYKNYQIVDKENFIIDQNFFKDKVYIKESFAYPLSNNEYNDIKVITEINKVKDYKNNSVIGVVKVILKNEELFKTKVYVKKEKKNIFELIIKKILDLFR